MRLAASLACALALSLAACGPTTTPAADALDTAEATAGITLADAWAAATPEGAANGAGYVVIHNDSDTADRLVSASSPRADHLELHEMRMDGAVMTMSPVEGIDVPAHGEATLAPGGLHIMFIGLTAPLLDGETAPVTLHFEHQGDVEASFPVRPRTQMNMEDEHAGH